MRAVAFSKSTFCQEKVIHNLWIIFDNKAFTVGIIPLRFFPVRGRPSKQATPD